MSIYAFRYSKNCAKIIIFCSYCFISLAVKKERAIQMVTLDPHGPNELRCNGTLSNVAEFLAAFEIVEGDAMFLPAEQRVDIW